MWIAECAKPNSLEDELRFFTDLRESVIPFSDP